MNEDALSGRLLDLAREHGVPGGQFALRHDGATHTVLFGEEEAGSGRPVREDSKFPTGSITKAFTAALAMVLVDEGDLDLDLPLADQLPELRVPEASFGEKQTLRQLLSHSSGLPPGRDSDDLAETTRRRYLADCARMRPIPECGSSFSYSNIGYVVTGFLVEHVARMEWREALETILLTPLGVEPAYITPPAGRPHVPGHAARAAGAAALPVRQTLPRIEAAAGALALSAADLLAYGLLHTDDAPGVPGLLDAEALVPMGRPVPGADPFGLADGWGLGLSRYRAGDGSWRVGHDGTSDGTSCHLRVDPATGTVAALTTNANTGMALWEELAAELAADGLDLAGYSYSGADRERGEVPAPPECQGTYENGDTTYTIDLAADGEARLKVGGEPFARLTFHEDLSFTMRELAANRLSYLGRFLRAPETGRLEQIQVTGRRAQRV
ncbi:serine hydrolase domain-containing protein [Streptomyces albidoflavus]|uniref:serine hydrolase domain-containing protein n=1 Tax=Streptomyces albidoflavus TaxID=1886 RepID=UPI0033DCA9D4